MPTTSLPSDRALEGSYHGSVGAPVQRAILRVSGDFIVVVVEDESFSFPVEDLEVSRKKGGLRCLRLSGGAIFETRDHKGVEHIVGRPGAAVPVRERVGLALTVTGLLVILGVVLANYGRPFLSHQIAMALPLPVVEEVSRETLRFIDATWAEPSRLDERTRERLYQLVSRYAPGTPEVAFRFAEELGPDIVALPDGTMILTDQLIRTVQDDQELIALIAHELGHVSHRHSLQVLVRDSLSDWLLALVVGDMGVVRKFDPSALVKNTPTKAMEREADLYGLDFMLRNNLDPMRFVRVVRRIASLNEVPGFSGGDTLEPFGDLMEERISEFEKAVKAVEESL